LHVTCILSVRNKWWLIEYKDVSLYTRIGPRFNVPCTNIVTSDGSALQWVDNKRYLGVFIIQSRIFKCNRQVSMIFKSPQVHMYIPCLLYGLDACPINRTDGNSRHYCIRRALCKIFHTTSQSIILDCQNYFNFPDKTVSLQQRKSNFFKKCAASENSLWCQCLRSFAQRELEPKSSLTDFNCSLDDFVVNFFLCFHSLIVYIF